MRISTLLPSILAFTLLLSFSPTVYSQDQEVEPNESFLTATLKQMDVDIEGSIGFSRDRDMYKVTINESGVLTMRVLNVPAAVNLSIFLFNANQGDEIRGIYTRDFGVAIGTQLSICQPGEYFILIRDFSFNGGPHTDFDSTMQYTLRTSFESFPEEDNCDCSNETFRDACPISLDTNFVATIAPPFKWPFITGFTSINTERDIDFYELNVTEPGALEFNITRPTEGFIKFNIYDSNQEIIYDDRISSILGSRFGISICDPGVYFVRIIDNSASEWNFSASNTYSYNSVFTPFANTDPCECDNQTINESCSINLCDTVFAISGAPFSSPDISDFESDFFSFELPSSDGYRIDLVNPTGLLLDLLAINPDQSGAVLVQNINSNGLSRIVPQTNSGTHYISISNRRDPTDFNHEVPYYFTVGCNQVSEVNDLLSSKDLFSLKSNLNTSTVSLELMTREASEIVIQSTSGQRLYRELLAGHVEEHTIDIDHLSKGVYYIQCVTGGYIQTLSFVKM